MKKLLIFLLVLLSACKGETTPESGAVEGAEAASVKSGTAVVTMEGATHELKNINWATSLVKAAPGELQLSLAQDDNPVSLNFIVEDAALQANGAKVYTFPEAKNADGAIDLNFLNTSRKGVAMQQRVVFSEGSLEIQELTEHSLKMTFKGAGHPLMTQDTFPIEGTIDIKF